jgi:type 1 fimbriae regulatory protein FimB/type 1 fimbriae regulatory protein FimE
MAKSSLALVAPATKNQTIAPLRRPNAALRTREHLTADEVERLIEAAMGNRQGHRDALMMLLAFCHGLRAAEVCDLRWEQIDFTAASLHAGASSTAPPRRIR